MKRLGAQHKGLNKGSLVYSSKPFPLSLKTLIIASWGLTAAMLSSGGRPESAVVVLEGSSREAPTKAVDIK
jgi:hypothetical protein